MTTIRPAIENALIDLMPKLPELFTVDDVGEEWPLSKPRDLTIRTTLKYGVAHGWLEAHVKMLAEGKQVVTYRKLPPKEFEFERTPQHQAWDKWKLENNL